MNHSKIFDSKIATVMVLRNMVLYIFTAKGRQQFWSWVCYRLARCRRPAYKFLLLLVLTLYMTWSGFLSQLLESPHCFHIETSSKLAQDNGGISALQPSIVCSKVKKLVNGSSPDVPGKHIGLPGLSAPLLQAPHHHQFQALQIPSSCTSLLISQMPTSSAQQCASRLI